MTPEQKELTQRANAIANLNRIAQRAEDVFGLLVLCTVFLGVIAVTAVWHVFG
jgi:hypothetical protein